VTPRVRLAVVAAMLLLLVLFAFWPSDVASDMPVSAVPITGFEAIRTAGSTVVGTSNPSPAVPQPRTLTPAPSPAPATLTPSARVRLASVRSSGEPQRGQSPSPAASATAVQRGTASTYGPAFGPGWLAVPQGPGIRVRVCGSGGCIVRTSTDAGPDLAMQRLGRIVDLSVRDFELVCGCSWTVGLVPVSVEEVQ
jgi:hypothetical protein